MDDNTPVTPATQGGNPTQDNVKAPAVTAPAVTARQVTAPLVAAPARPKGPNASAIIVGLVTMFLAGLIIAKETMGLRVDWSRLGPGAIVGIGVVLVVIGAIGLVRRRDHV